MFIIQTFLVRWSKDDDDIPLEDAGGGEDETSSRKNKKKAIKKGKPAAKAKAVAKQKSKKKEAADSGPYKPGVYSDTRKQYIQRMCAKKNLSFRDAAEMWKSCSKRQELLAEMPLAEQKRRRFI